MDKSNLQYINSGRLGEDILKYITTSTEKLINKLVKEKGRLPQLYTDPYWDKIAKKLKTLVVKYGYSFSREDVIKATKEYVNSFNGNYRYMQLLKYFILKSVKDADDNVDIKSELMSLIENSGQLDTQRDDWVSNRI